MPEINPCLFASSRSNNSFICSDSFNNTYSNVVKMPTIVVKSSIAPKKPTVPIDPVCDPSNPSHCITIWVGNVNQSVTQSTLLQQFQKYLYFFGLGLGLDINGIRY